MVLGSRQQLWLGARCRNPSAACWHGAGGRCRCVCGTPGSACPRMLEVSISGTMRWRGRWQSCHHTRGGSAVPELLQTCPGRFAGP